MYKSFIRLRFNEVGDYLSELDHLIHMEQLGLQQRIKEEEDEDMVEIHIDDLYRFDQTYPQLLRSSALIAAFSIFESSFFRICEIISQELPSAKTFAITNKIDICWSYLKKIGMDLKPFEDQWKEISKIREIRNLIAHNSSNFVKDKSKGDINKLEIYKYIIDTPSLEVKNERGDFAINDTKYISRFCDLGRRFLNGVVDQINPRLVTETKP